MASTDSTVELPPAGLPRPLDLGAGPRGVLLFHGLSSGPLELQYLARGLQRAGYTVRVPVLDGYSHGGQAPAANRHTHRRWIDWALAEFDALAQRCERVAVGGLCIGAVLALQVAASRVREVDAVMALSTTLHYDGWAVPLSRRLLPLAAWVPPAGAIAVRERSPFGLKDERLRGWIEQQMLAQGNSAAGAAQLRVRDLLAAQRLITATRVALPRIEAPLLAVHAREDDAASTRSAYELVQRVRSSNTRLVLLRDSYHMISIDREKTRVLEEMRAFLDARDDLPARRTTPGGQLIALHARASERSS